MRNVITSKDVREGIKNGLMKFLTKEKLQIVEVVEGHVYQAKKLTKDGKYRSFVRFNDVSLSSALETVEKYYI